MTFRSSLLLASGALAHTAAVMVLLLRVQRAPSMAQTASQIASGWLCMFSWSCGAKILEIQMTKRHLFRDPDLDQDSSLLPIIAALSQPHDLIQVRS